MEKNEIRGLLDLSSSDSNLGELFLAAWLEHQAAKLGFPLLQMPREWAAGVVAESAKMDSDSVKTAVLESIFRKACKGEFETAGRMLRSHILQRTEELKTAKEASLGIAVRAGNRKGARNSADARRADAEQRHKEWREEAERLRVSGRGDRDIAGILATRFGVTPRAIRDAMKQK